MSALLTDLQIHNFRNHDHFIIQEPRQLIIIVGKNASGKTNIIEAVQLVTMLESFKNPVWSSVIRNSADKKEETTARIKAVFLQNERIIEIQMDIQEGKREYSLNGKKRNRIDLIGLIPAIIFVPDDLMLVKSSSEVRRKLIDDIGQQLSSTYLKILNDYQKTIKQRNAILKNCFFEKQNQALLESWDENLIILGALLFTHRIRLYKRYMEKACFFYQKINSEEKFSSRYIPSFVDSEEDESAFSNDADSREQETKLVIMGKEEVEKRLFERLEAVREKEKMQARSLVGPHRDDIRFYINGLEARKFASQGQQRSIALALKLGQLELIREISGNQPILLLDDVMSELDESRREALIRAIDGQIQTIITSTDLSCFNESLLKSAQIIELLRPSADDHG